MKRLVTCSLYPVCLFIFFFIFGCEEDEVTGPFIPAGKNEGTDYASITIGEQVWMAENLRVTRYRNGDPIAYIEDPVEWTDSRQGAFCVYENSVGNEETYGLLYNWYAVVDTRNLAPEGWHSPTDEEWMQLELSLGMNLSEVFEEGYRGTDTGGKLKESETFAWNSPNQGASNEAGFSALPAGSRDGIWGRFSGLGEKARFWTSSEYDPVNGWCRLLNYNHAGIGRFSSSSNKRCGYSIRCIRD
jgi:uncharacterized protein (TIGR02145 family)